MSGIVTALELRAKRAKLHEQGKAILEGAKDRELTAEERAAFDKVSTDMDAMKADIDRVEKWEAEGRELEASKAETREVTERAKPGSPEERLVQKNEATSRWLSGGDLTPEQRALIGVRAGEGGRQEITLHLRTPYERVRDRYLAEQRAAQTVTTTAGGYLIPRGFSDMLEVSMLAYGGVEKVADIFETETGNTLDWPTITDSANTGRLLAINTAATETALAYGQTVFAAYKFSSDMVTVPVELMQDSAFGMDAHVAEMLGIRLGRVHNTYQTTGTGSSQPQGISVGSSSGVTAASTTEVTADELLDLVHSIDPAYRSQPGAGFMFNDTALKKLRKLKDGEGRYLWQAGMNTGAPDSLLGYPITINQDMPAMTTGLKPILFGALKKFKIRKVKGITLVRLVERYGELHQVAFLAFTRWDSKVLDAGTDPIKSITLA